MSKYPALPFFCDAWTLDTKHLTRSERGTYLDLLILVWTTPKCRVPNDPAWIEKRLGYPPGDPELAKIINEFCTPQRSRHWLTQKRLQKEYSYLKAEGQNQSKRSKSRWGNGKNLSPPPHPSSSLRKKGGSRARVKSAGAPDPPRSARPKLTAEERRKQEAIARINEHNRHVEEQRRREKANGKEEH